jgi:hypothetical protein
MDRWAYLLMQGTTVFFCRSTDKQENVIIFSTAWSKGYTKLQDKVVWWALFNDSIQTPHQIRST